MYRVKLGKEDESYEKRKKDLRCSLGEHRTLQNMVSESGEQKGVLVPQMTANANVFVWHQHVS